MRPLFYLLISLVILSAIACAMPAPVTVSPLPTWDPSTAESFTDATVGDGTLEFSANCVTLALDNQKTILLIWPEPTTWDSTKKTVELVDVLGNRLELHEGDRIMPSGSTPAGEPKYVTPPRASCIADEQFIVNAISVIPNQ